ncbi:DNA topoisomerase VI subunit A [Pyrenophora tritici-repentis]|uniref:DNA topoisomerase (ATP-hydrolyzing) n=1 Tax=Pyrenophora tritici-repentis TaxID=45151 RepID=A0A2W1EZT4_9PLEO|nr:Meiosis-specific topoisomerase Spo11/meiotic recombination protein spo11 [Pyrenophora tritici-repentis]KAF7443331.1 Meiosis-specific topoisomerase Spo11/meiotic recombination protein spo11 [Pyrenophora tritici-repentis]KAF7568177.1 DNA topoisomerase VI, subunit A [Pyrenophora tritici-repentis]KAG9376980.1 Meiosis-specific topoisomerase Spo11/meiotic recombination protein spo11 [Pyrenophora tritici-repentis]KAI0579467.1 Meiosis-specific topoisomerase Spo11/meiotic recombination protein spo11 
MDTSDFEDMLFGEPFTQIISDDALMEDSEDEILFSASGEPPLVWHEPYAAISTSPIASTFVETHIPNDTTLHNYEQKERPLRDRHWVIARIEAMLERIVDGLIEESDSLTITLQSRAALSRRQITITEAGGKLPEPKERDINFPGASAQEAWNFTVLLRILELIHGGLVDDTMMTKRDIYYRHPDLFVRQSVVDRYVDDLACTFGITRSQLNVTAAAKGLVAGNFRLDRENGHRIHGMTEKEGMLVPIVGENDTLDLSEVHWVLVIEKEATFRSLMASPQWGSLGSYGVILTAKGYPDVASRNFLRQMVDCAPHVPMYVFVDLDPEGIAILSTYKYGSYRLAHEAVTPTDTPAISLPNIRWLGVKSHHMSRTPVGEDDTEPSAMPQLQGLMKLTARDRTKAARMLEWNLCAEDGPEQGWRQELQKMLMFNIKAEMQILDELPGGLISWLSSELGSDYPEDAMLF